MKISIFNLILIVIILVLTLLLSSCISLPRSSSKTKITTVPIVIAELPDRPILSSFDARKKAVDNKDILKLIKLFGSDIIKLQTYAKKLEVIIASVKRQNKAIIEKMDKET